MIKTVLFSLWTDNNQFWSSMYSLQICFVALMDVLNIVLHRKIVTDVSALNTERGIFRIQTCKHSTTSRSRGFPVQLGKISGCTVLAIGIRVQEVQRFSAGSSTNTARSVIIWEVSKTYLVGLLANPKSYISDNNYRVPHSKLVMKYTFDRHKN